MASPRCCQERDARHCQQIRPGMHTSLHEQLPEIFVPHFEQYCRCFSCRWVQETKCRFVLSKLEDQQYPIANPTHVRVSRGERQRLLAPVPKKKFQIMYIYAMQLEDKTWGWVVVLPLPLLPFLLTDEKYSEVSRFARHPVSGWFGLREDGEKIDMEQEMEPPLYNPFYTHYGYDPLCSPYRVYRPPSEGNSSDNEANPSTEGRASSSTRSSTTSSSHESSETNSSSEGQTVLVTRDHTNSTSMSHANLKTGKLTNECTECQAITSGEAQATSSKPPADQSSPGSDEWLVLDTCCTNPQEASGPDNARCSGQYYGQRYGDHHTNWRNTTIFVGGLRPNMTREDLHQWFEGFGELMHVRKKRGETCGFVQYPDRMQAEMAISQMQGYPIAGSRLRLSWGKPEKHVDQRYWEYYQQSTWRAYHGYINFRQRMERNEPRREHDPDFWTD